MISKTNKTALQYCKAIIYIAFPMRKASLMHHFVWHKTSILLLLEQNRL